MRDRKYYTHQEIAKLFDRNVPWVQVLVITGELSLGEYRRRQWRVPAPIVDELYESSTSHPLPEFGKRTRNRRIRTPEELWKERIRELGKRKNQLANSARCLEFLLITEEDASRLRELEAEKETILTELAECQRLGERYGFTGTGLGKSKKSETGSVARARSSSRNLPTQDRVAAKFRRPREVWRRMVRDFREESRRIDTQIEDLYLERRSWDSPEMDRLKAEKQEVLQRLKHFNGVGLREGFLKVDRSAAPNEKARFLANEPELPWSGGYANRGPSWYQDGW